MGCYKFYARGSIPDMECIQAYMGLIKNFFNILVGIIITLWELLFSDPHTKYREKE